MVSFLHISRALGAQRTKILYLFLKKNVGSSKLVMEEIFTPWKSANSTNQDSFFPPIELVTSRPIGAFYLGPLLEFYLKQVLL